MKSQIKALISFLISLAIVFFVVYFVQPQLEKLTVSVVQEFSQKKLPAEIKIQDLKFSWIPTRLHFKNIEIQPKQNALSGISALKIETMTADLDFLKFLTGQLVISKVEIDSSAIKINLDDLLKDPSSDNTINLDPIFKALPSLPLLQVILKNIKVELLSEKLHTQASLQIDDVTAINKRTFLIFRSLVDFKAQHSLLETESGKINLNLRLYPNKIEVFKSSLKIDELEAFFEGEANDLTHLLETPQITLKGTLNTNLKPFQKMMAAYKVPHLEGEFNIPFETQWKGQWVPESQLEVHVKDFKLIDYLIGNFSFKAEQSTHSLYSKEVEVLHPSGTAQLKNLQLSWKNKLFLQAEAHIASLNLYELLKTLHLPTVPVELMLKGHLPCEGELSPSFLLKCKGRLEGKNLVVKSSRKETKEIVRLQEFNADGTLEIDAQEVRYNTQVGIKNDKGQSKGKINYATGFDISYSTPLLHFPNITNLAHLKLLGEGSLEGSTHGDSNAGVFEMKIQGKNVDFEDFYLGNPQILLNYEKGQLNFNHLQGNINKSKYEGELTVDLNTSQIKGEFMLPHIEGLDIQASIHKWVPIPFEITGSGTSHIKFWGPLNFAEMNYKLESQLNKGAMAGEPFDKFVFDVTAKDGEFRAEHVYIFKNNSTIILTGSGHPQGNLDLLLEGNRLKIEESENLNKISSKISGILNFSMSIQGVAKQPEMNLKGSLTELLFDEEEMSESHFAVKLSKENLKGSADLFDNKIQSTFEIPFDDENPFRFKMSTHEWNFATLISLLTERTNLTDFNSSITANIDLSSESGGFFKSTGFIDISKFLLQRDQLSIQNTQPMNLVMQDGYITLNGFELIGQELKYDKSYLSLTGKDFTNNHLNFNINGRLDLKLVQLFTPFFEDLGGQGTTSINVNGSIFKPELLGSASIEEGFIKLKGFPHPLEKLRSEIKFSHSKISLTSITGQVAGGNLVGDGDISLLGYHNLPINIRGQIEGVHFNIPDKIKTSGHGEIVFSGNWFPYTLSGNYHVESGLIEKDFGEDSSGSKNEVKQSAYLPKVLLESAFNPINLNLQVIIDNDLMIKNPQIEGMIKGQLQIKGPPDKPNLQGKIVLDKNSKLLFRDKIFEVLNGTIQFQDPHDINPELFISARSHVNEYDVNLLIQGSAKNIQLRLSSMPPLTEPDIVSLLALGITSSHLEKNVQSKEQEAQSSYQIGSAILSKNPLNKQLQDRLGLNLQFSSAFDESRNVAVPKITLSKPLSNKLKASASRTFGDQSAVEVKLQYSINQNISAVGVYENREAATDTRSINTQQTNSSNIFGLDLEFKREFK